MNFDSLKWWLGFFLIGTPFAVISVILQDVLKLEIGLYRFIPPMLVTAIYIKMVKRGRPKILDFL
jgi:hypothetical protein